jgi:hypothetical protein
MNHGPGQREGRSPRVRSKLPLTDSAFDDFTRVFAGCADRRSVLKALVLVIAGTFVGPELLAACESGKPSPTPSPSPSHVPMSECPPGELERCCTPAQVKACVDAGSAAFGSGAHKCRAICGKQTPPLSLSCESCRQSAIAQTISAYKSCKSKTCLILSDLLPPKPSPTLSATISATSSGIATTGASGASALELVAIKDPLLDPLGLLLQADGATPCNYSIVQKCLADAEAHLKFCLEFALASCAAGFLACEITALGCLTLNAYEVAKCLHDDGCPRPGNTFCTTGNVCCPLRQTGCGGACCSELQSCCGGPSASECVNTLSDPSNCGECEHACNAGEDCEFGVCIGCPNGQTRCSRQCVDTNTDQNNCGKCGVRCLTGYDCVGGDCVCSSGYTMCNGICVNLQTDNNNCGGCSTDCAAGTKCCGGVCQCGGTEMCCPPVNGGGYHCSDPGQPC